MHAEGQRFESVILHKRFDRGVEKRDEREPRRKERGARRREGEGERRRGREKERFSILFIVLRKWLLYCEI